jgi:protein TorT
VFVEFDTMGFMTGDYLVKQGVTGNAVTFPGPQGSGWAESFNDGFKKALDGSKIKVLDQKFGDSGVAVQQKLVEDALQAYPDMNVIWGTAPTAEAAIGAVEEAGQKGKITIMSSYENQAMLDAMNKGDILGFATQWPVMEGKISIDLAVRALEKKPFMEYIYTKPEVVTKESAPKMDMSGVLAPADWQPVYKVD